MIFLLYAFLLNDLSLEYWISRSFTFIGVIFEEGNVARKKVWSGLGAEQNIRVEGKEWFFVHRCFRGCDKKRCEKIFCSREDCCC